MIWEFYWGLGVIVKGIINWNELGGGGGEDFKFYEMK